MFKTSRPLARVLWLLTAIACLAGVFGMYTQPDFLVQLSSQLWACF